MRYLVFGKTVREMVSYMGSSAVSALVNFVIYVAVFYGDRHIRSGHFCRSELQGHIVTGELCPQQKDLYGNGKERRETTIFPLLHPVEHTAGIFDHHNILPYSDGSNGRGGSQGDSRLFVGSVWISRAEKMGFRKRYGRRREKGQAGWKRRYADDNREKGRAVQNSERVRCNLPWKRSGDTIGIFERRKCFRRPSPQFPRTCQFPPVPSRYYTCVGNISFVQIQHVF